MTATNQYIYIVMTKFNTCILLKPREFLIHVIRNPFCIEKINEMREKFVVKMTC